MDHGTSHVAILEKEFNGPDVHFQNPVLFSKEGPERDVAICEALGHDIDN
jgi:hypothetical protein